MRVYGCSFFFINVSSFVTKAPGDRTSLGTNSSRVRPSESPHGLLLQVELDISDPSQASNSLPHNPRVRPGTPKTRVSPKSSVESPALAKQYPCSWLRPMQGWFRYVQIRQKTCFIHTIHTNMDFTDSGDQRVLRCFSWVKEVFPEIKQNLSKQVRFTQSSPSPIPVHFCRHCASRRHAFGSCPGQRDVGLPTRSVCWGAQSRETPVSPCST